MLRSTLVLLLLLTGLNYVISLRIERERASKLLLKGDHICSHLSKGNKIRCQKAIGGYRFDVIAANLCVSHSGDVDFICLDKIKNAMFQANMVDLCIGQNPSYLRLCLMALKNKVYSDTERASCEESNTVVDRVLCLSQVGRPHG